MTRAGLALVLLATLSGCVGHEMLLVEYCDPEYSRWPDGTVKGYMRTPCVGWTDGTTVARKPEQLPVGPVPPHKSLIIYRDGAHVEALVLDQAGGK